MIRSINSQTLGLSLENRRGASIKLTGTDLSIFKQSQNIFCVDFSARKIQPRNVAPHPVNIPGGINPIRIVGNPTSEDYHNALSIWLEAREKLLLRAKNILALRQAKGILCLAEGSQTIVYGISFIYNARKGDFIASVADAVTFLEHLAGILEKSDDYKKVNDELKRILLDLSTMQPIHIARVDVKPGVPT